MKIIETIKSLSPLQQIEILVDFAAEIGGSVQVTRNMYYLYWSEHMRTAWHNRIMELELVKARIMELTKEIADGNKN